MCDFVRTLIEPVVALNQIGSSFFDTALLIVVQERYQVINSTAYNSTPANVSTGEKQDGMTHFFMIYHTLSRLITLFSTFYFAKLGDLKSRKITIVVPLVGCLISRSLLLFVIIFNLPLEIIFATASLDGLSGGFTTYWTGVVSLVCNTCSEQRRSVRLITTDFTYGLAGFVGSILSGYIFHLKISNYHGIILVALSLSLYVFNLFYCILVLKVPPKQQQSGRRGDDEQNKESNTFTEKLQCDRTRCLVKHEHVTDDIQPKDKPLVEKAEHKTTRHADDKNGKRVNGQCCKTISRIFDGIIRDNWSSWWADSHEDKGTFWLMVGAAVLYDVATKGAMDVLPIFVLNWPLKWNVILLGYGNASEYAIYFTSFLAVCLFSKCVKDTSLIMIGMLSFSAGMLVMGFVKRTYLYFIACNQIASALYDTALLMVVKERCELNSTLMSQEHSYQRGVARFYMIYNLVAGLTSLIFTCTLARLGDHRSRKLTICVPLLGYLISRALLLLVVLLRMPLEVMFGAAALYGVSGGFTAYWTGVMAIASVTSSEESRAVKLITVELVYGLAGLLGSLASGHIFIHFKISHYQGAALVCLCLALYTLSLLYSIFVLRVPPEQSETGLLRNQQSDSRGFPEPGTIDTGQPTDGSPSVRQPPAETSHCLADSGQEYPRAVDGTPWETSGLPDDQDNTRTPIASSFSMDKVTLGLLFAGGVLYDLAVTGGVDVLSIFVLKAPLSWNAIWVGYGNASGYFIFMSSFLGVRLFSRCMKDTSLIVIGMVSFSSGILIMAYVKWTFLFFIARAVMMFALIPLPTIRAVISKQIQCTSYGKMFGMLQIFLTLTSIIASTVFIQIYILTKDWFPGFCFCLSTIISCLSIIPIVFVVRRMPERSGYTRISGN